MSQPKKICSVDGCDIQSRTRGYCARHYKQILRHERLTPDREHRTWCRIEGCDKPHKARGYCSSHYIELISHGEISNNGKIRTPFCPIFECNKKPFKKGLCKQHYDDYNDIYILNGYSWKQVDRIIISHNQSSLRRRNRLQLIRTCHRELISKLEPDATDLLHEDDFDNMDIRGRDPDKPIQSLEADDYESSNLWEEELFNMREVQDEDDTFLL